MATVSSGLNSGSGFANSDVVTSTNLNNHVNSATVTNIVAADISSDAITTAKILNSNVTKAKIENVANFKVLGNVSGSATAPSEVTILDEDDMSSDSNTSLVTQQSVKAFVDNLISTADKSGSGLISTGTQGSITLGGGLVIKYGTFNSAGASGIDDVTFQNSSGANTAFSTAVYGVLVTPQENPLGGAEQASVSDVTVSGFKLRTYSSGSGAAVGRVFFVAVGH